jgi:hypothetical protein
MQNAAESCLDVFHHGLQRWLEVANSLTYLQGSDGRKRSGMVIRISQLQPKSSTFLTRMVHRALKLVINLPMPFVYCEVLGLEA